MTDTTAVRALADYLDDKTILRGTHGLTGWVIAEERRKGDGAAALRQCADEIERLQAGGCARNQRTTQHCATAADMQAELDALRGQAMSSIEREEYFALKEDAGRWQCLVRTASLGFDGAPSWNAVIRLPVFDSSDQTITALVDRARKGTT